MRAIESAGSNYGLVFNWAKLEMLAARCEADILKPDGGLVPRKEHLVFLGSVLSTFGSAGPELNRRQGQTKAECEALSQV